MDSIIGLLKDTPIPTILVVSGIVFLFLALAGSVAGKLEMPPARQKWSAFASFVLLTAGLLLYILPGSARQPPSKRTHRLLTLLPLLPLLPGRRPSLQPFKPSNLPRAAANLQPRRQRATPPQPM